MTLSDLEWPFRTLRAISAVAELLVSFVSLWILCTVWDWLFCCQASPSHYRPDTDQFSTWTYLSLVWV